MGHTAVAKALRTYLLMGDPNCQVEIMETSTHLSPKVALLLGSLYLTFITRAPVLWGYLYATSRQQAGWMPIWHLLHVLIYKEMATILGNLQPDVVVCTHPFPSAIVSRLKLGGFTSAPLFTVVTDYCTHASWRSSAVDGYLLPTESVRLLMQKSGVPANRMMVTGIPIQPKFHAHKDKRDARSSLGVLDRPTILVMGGGLGLGFQIEDLDRLLRDYPDLQLLIVTGTNAQLRLKVAALLDHAADRIHVYGYADNVDELMDASDMIITKPGAVTCTEAMAKRLPIILSRPLPGQEQDNSQHLISQGYAVDLSDRQALAACLDDLVSNDGRLKRHFPGILDWSETYLPELNQSISRILGHC